MIDFKNFFDSKESLSNSTNDKVLICDGLNSFLRVFASIPQISDNGEHIGGIVGFLRSIGSNIREYGATRCIIVFDGKGGSLRRRKLFPEYKNNRTGNHQFRRNEFATYDDEQASMKRQFRRILEYLQHLPVQFICIDNIEADDVIAYLTKQYFEPKGSKVRIVSTDRDFLQLISDNVEIYSPVKKKVYRRKELEEEIGIVQENYLLYRALTGDNSDNIPGIKGIGLKTLIKEFRELSEKKLEAEYLYSTSKVHIEETKKPKQIFKSIVENWDVIEMNLKLMQLGEVDISLNSIDRIVGSVESEIPQLNKYQIRKMAAEDSLGFKNLDEWLLMTFNSLNVRKT